MRGAIPLLDNDNRSFMNHEVTTTLTEIGNRFGGFSFSAPSIGYWRSEQGAEYWTDQILLTVDVPDSHANLRWFETQKRRWMTRLRQLALYTTFHPIELVP